MLRHQGARHGLRECRELAARIAGLRSIGRGFPVLAMTATATPRIIEDVVSTLDMRAPLLFRSTVNRANLAYSVQTKRRGGEAACATQVADIIAVHSCPGKNSCIVYVTTRAASEGLAELLNVRTVSSPTCSTLAL